MGTMHAWQSFGDGAAPDLQAVAKGLGGGRVLHIPSLLMLLIGPQLRCHRCCSHLA